MALLDHFNMVKPVNLMISGGPKKGPKRVPKVVQPRNPKHKGYPTNATMFFLHD